jgi:hypothetical protein
MGGSIVQENISARPSTPPTRVFTANDELSVAELHLSIIDTDSNVTAPMRLVDPKEHIEDDPRLSTVTIRPGMEDLAKLFITSNRIEEVNQEQLDRVRMSK